MLKIFTFCFFIAALPTVAISQSSEGFAHFSDGNANSLSSTAVKSPKNMVPNEDKLKGKVLDSQNKYKENMQKIKDCEAKAITRIEVNACWQNIKTSKAVGEAIESLDKTSDSYEDILDDVTKSGFGMPGFNDRLTQEQMDQIKNFKLQ